jgi:hypothetical protein
MLQVSLSDLGINDWDGVGAGNGRVERLKPALRRGGLLDGLEQAVAGRRGVGVTTSHLDPLLHIAKTIEEGSNGDGLVGRGGSARLRSSVAHNSVVVHLIPALCSISYKSSGKLALARC